MNEKRISRIRDHARICLRRALVLVKAPAVSLGRHRPRTARAAIALLAAGLSLFVTATAANATTYTTAFGQTVSTFSSDPGKLAVGVTCDVGTLRADVDLQAETPNAYPNGVWLYTQVYVKEHSASAWTYWHETSPFVLDTVYDTWAGPANAPQSFDSTYFYGTLNHQYDVLVKYWWAPPGGSWRGPYGLPAQIFYLRSLFGFASLSSTCTFVR
jgi:hypothetical protein